MSEPFDRTLRAAARRGRPVGVCPDAAMLAAYADNGLTADERHSLETHAADCVTCQQHLALLGAVSLDRDVPQPSRSWLTQWGWLVPLATAALVVAVWIRLPEHTPERQAPAGQVEVATPPADKPAAVPEPGAPPRESTDRVVENEASRRAAKVAQLTPHSSKQAEGKLDEFAPLERDQAQHRVAAAAVPPRTAATPAATPGPRRADDSRAVPTPGGRAAGEAAAQAAPPAAPAPALADAAKAKEAKEETQSLELARRRESTLQKSAAAIAPPIVVTASPTESYRVGGHSIERSADGGATWQLLSSVPDVALTAAACAPGGPCWFGGTDGVVLRQTATALSRSRLPARTAVRTIAPEGPLGASVTLDDGQRFRTTDGGTTWHPIP